MADNKKEKRTFKWGDQEYVLDDLLKLHAAHENSYYDFARTQGSYNDEALKGLRSAIASRIQAVKDGQVFEGDGKLESDIADNIRIQTKKGLTKKNKYVEQDNTEWAKYYMNKLVSQLSPYSKPEDTSKKWDVNKHGLGAYLTGQGLNAREVFEKYDIRDVNNPDAARSYDQRRKLLKGHLEGYKKWLAGKGFDFTKNDNEWDDTFGADFDKFVADYDKLDANGLAVALRKFGAGNEYTTAFTSDRWKLSKTDEAAENAERERRKAEEKAKKEKEDLRKWEDYSYSQRIVNPVAVYNKPISFSDPSIDFRKWYGDLNEAERSKYGTYLGLDDATWLNAWNTYTKSLRDRVEYSDKNARVLLQGIFKNQPHGFMDLGNGLYLIRDSISESGQGTVYDPKSGYTSSVWLGDLAGSNEEIKKLYKNLAYKYLNANHGTNYDSRSYVFHDGGELIPKHQYGNAVRPHWGSTDEVVQPKATTNGVTVKTQKAKDQYLDSDNKSADNPNAGWDAKHYVRLGSAIADLSAAVAGFIPGGGTAYAGIAGVGSTLANFGVDMFDDAVTSGEMWRNLGLNLGMDVLGLVPGGGAASKMGKIVKTLKSTVPLIVMIPGVVNMLANSPEIASSWKKAFDGDSADGGSKMDYQDYMNILQVLNVAAGATNIARNTYRSGKASTKLPDKIAVEVTETSGKNKGKKRALVFEGEDAVKFKEANADGKAQEFINNIEGGNKYTITQTTTSNAGKFWGRDANDDFHLFYQNPLGRTQTGQARMLNLRTEIIRDKFGRPILDKNNRPQTRYYAETGRWEADLVGTSKPTGGDIVSMKGRQTLDQFAEAQNKAIKDQLTDLRQKASKYSEKTNKAKEILAEVQEDITTKTAEHTDLSTRIAEQQSIIDQSNADIANMQNWINSGGLVNSKKVIANLRGQITRHEKALKNEKSPKGRRKLKQQIEELEAKINQAQAERDANTPEAVKAAQDAAANAGVEKTKLETKLAQLQAMLDVRNKQKTHLSKRVKQHSAAYEAIKDFKDIKAKFNGEEHTFSAPQELLNLDNLFKHGGSIRRNKLDNFLKHAKG